MKGIIALFQLYSAVSYIVTEKDRHRINDYAAFQLTLIPYGLMSVVNILCGLVTPSYSAVYMVNSTVMEEARGRGWAFDGIVGELCEETQEVKGKGYVGFQAAFSEETGAGSSKGGETNASLEISNDEIREIKTNPSPQVGESEIHEAELGMGSEGKLKLDFKIVPSKKTKKLRIFFSGVSFLQEGQRILNEAARELFLIRCYFLKDEDPGKDYAKRLFASKEGTDRKSTRQNIVIPPIGNPTYRKGSWWRFYSMLFISDLLVLGSLAFPHVATWILTRYKAPTGGKLNGIVFQAWLVLGQLSPLPGRIIWGYIQSHHLESFKRNMWYALIVITGTLWSVPAIMGFILVGKEKYRHPDAKVSYG